LASRGISSGIRSGGHSVDTHDRCPHFMEVGFLSITKATECHGRDCSLTAVDVRPSRLSGMRKVVDVIFSYTHRQTDVTEKYFVRVDVTEEFPFLVTKLSSYYGYYPDSCNFVR
jgi:PatG C-terminal